MSDNARDDLVGRIAVEIGLLTEEQLAEAVAEQVAAEKRGEAIRLEQLFLRKHLIDSDGLVQVLDEIQWRTSPSPLLERYEVQARLGSGAAAVVYRANDRKLGHPVALKVIQRARSIDRQRFQREVEAFQRLRHPNVVRVFDAGEEGDRMYLSMELVEGGSLRRLLWEGGSGREELAALLARIARAVHFAHEMGVVHRDLKPENILIATTGEPKVADLGLARLEDAETLLTRDGVLVGTPAYMSPEQVVGKWSEITKSVDVYALGCMLYEILTGRPPFEGRHATDLMLKILDQPAVPPRELDPTIPPFLEGVAMKALAKDRRQRQRTAAAFAEEIETFLNGEVVPSAPYPTAAPKMTRTGTMRRLIGRLRDGMRDRGLFSRQEGP